MLAIDRAGMSRLQHNIELNLVNFISHLCVHSVWSVGEEWGSAAHSHPRFPVSEALLCSLCCSIDQVVCWQPAARQRTERTQMIMAPWCYQAWRWQPYFLLSSLIRSQSYNHRTAGETGKCSLAVSLAVKRNIAFSLTETGLWWLVCPIVSLLPTLNHTFALRGKGNLFKTNAG